MVKITLTKTVVEFFAGIYNNDRAVDKVLLWAEKSPAAFQPLMDWYGKLNDDEKMHFRYLLAKHVPTQAKHIVAKVKLVADLTKTKGYQFKLKNGLLCEVKRLDRSEYLNLVYDRIYRKEVDAYAKREEEKATPEVTREALEKRIKDDFGVRAYVFQLQIKETKFGIVTGIVRSIDDVNTFRPNLIKTIAALKDSKILLSSETYFFINNDLYLPLSSGARAVESAIKHKVEPNIAVLMKLDEAAKD